MFRNILAFSLIFILGLTAFIYLNFYKNAPPAGQSTNQNGNTISINGIEIKIEIADNPMEQAQGLSGRTNLPENSGMMFVFYEPTIPGFWMKDMNFSLDLIWINEKGEIIEITRSVSPATYPKTFSPPSPVKYVLEVNSGWADKNNVKVGDSVSF